MCCVQVGCGSERAASNSMISLGMNGDYVVFMERLTDIVAPMFIRLYLCNDIAINPLRATLSALKYR